MGHNTLSGRPISPLLEKIIKDQSLRDEFVLLAFLEELIDGKGVGPKIYRIVSVGDGTTTCDRISETVKNGLFGYNIVEVASPGIDFDAWMSRSDSYLNLGLGRNLGYVTDIDPIYSAQRVDEEYIRRAQEELRTIHSDRKRAFLAKLHAPDAWSSEVIDEIVTRVEEVL